MSIIGKHAASHYNYAVLVVLIMSATVNSQTTTASPLIVLTSPLSDGQRVCPGDALTFTCVTNGSASLAWSSDDYIGLGGIQLEFGSFHDPGRIARNRASPIGTQAILISKEIEENETRGILESELNVIVISDYQTATLKCLHVDSGSEETAGFQLLDEPGAPEGVEIEEVPDDRRSRGICALTLKLNPPSNVGADEIPRLAYFVDYPSRRDEITTTSYDFVVQNCTPDLRINVTTVNRCGRMGGSVVNISPTFLPVPDSVTQGANVGLAVGLSIGIIAVVVVICVAVIVTVFLVKKYCYQSSAQDGHVRAEERHMYRVAGESVESVRERKVKKLVEELKNVKDLLSNEEVRKSFKAILRDEHVKPLIKEISEE